MYCGRPDGRGPRELRPYGPGGKDVCAECAFDGPPERLEEARRQFVAKLDGAGPGPVVIGESSGPRRLVVYRGRK